MHRKADLEGRIAQLETELKESRRWLEQSRLENEPLESRNYRLQHAPSGSETNEISEASTLSMSKLHSLLVISDSALPLGSFAFSSGLESLLMHQPKLPKQLALQQFLLHSLSSVARLALPYLSRAHREPPRLLDIDNDFDASTPCTVARRASLAQGRALLANWERALRLSATESEASRALGDFSRELRLSTDDVFGPCGHLPPIFGTVAAALQLNAYAAAYSFLLNHVKAVLSAAIRAGVLGPFQAQAVLSSQWLKDEVGKHAQMSAKIEVEDAGQVWVPGDLWIGRHELLYSRIFNS